MSDLTTLFLLIGSLLIMFVLWYLSWRRHNIHKLLEVRLQLLDVISEHLDTLMDYQKLIDESIRKEELYEKYVPLTEKKKSEILEMIDKGMSHRVIAEKLWVHKSTITHAVNKWDEETGWGWVMKK